MAGRRDGETAETAFERRELPRGPVTGDPVLVDGRDGRERREECRERGVEMGSAGPVAGEGMAEREEEWRRKPKPSLIITACKRKLLC